MPRDDFSSKVKELLAKKVAYRCSNPFCRAGIFITYVADRKGHDQRYAIDPSKAMAELGWAPTTMFKDSIKLTIQWYKKHMDCM